MATTTIKVAITFRDDVDPEICEYLEALPTGRARTVFLNRLILSGLEVHKKKGILKPVKQMKAEPKAAPMQKAKIVQEFNEPKESLPSNGTNSVGQTDTAKHQSVIEEDDFTREFVKGLGGVPKR